MKSIPHPAGELEWHAQEQALRAERAGIAHRGDPLLVSYRHVMRALRDPLPDALPVDFARTVAAHCRGVSVHASPVDTRLEQMLLRVLVIAGVACGAAAVSVYGDAWKQAAGDALPSFSGGMALHWSAAMVACIGLSWSFDLLRRRGIHQ